MLKKVIKSSLFAMAMLVTTSLSFSNATIVKGDELNGVIEERYSAVLSQWEKNGMKSPENFSKTISPNELTTNGSLLEQNDSKEYTGQVLQVKPREDFSFQVEVEEEGLYEINMDYLPLTSGLASNEADFKVNGKYPYYEARRVVFSTLWTNETLDFATDRYGNQVVPSQKQEYIWQNMYLTDASKSEEGNLKIHLNKGVNTIEFTQKSGEVLIGNIEVTSEEKIMSYEEYANKYSNEKLVNNSIITIEAEKNTYKNDTGARQNVSRDTEALPYDTHKQLLNTFGGESWSKGGQTVYYEVNIPESGLYNLAFKVKQNFKAETSVYRKITIDNKVPFKEAGRVNFENSSKWQTVVLGNENPYGVYLEKGKHLIGLEADSTIYASLITTINNVMGEINKLSLDVKKLVGSNDDRFRDWEILEFIPDVQDQLNGMANDIEVEYNKAVELNGGNTESQGFISLRRAMDTLRKLAEEPNELPNNLGQLSEGSSSVSQILGDTIIELQKQPLILDQIYVYSGEESLPDYKVSLLTKATEGTKRFVKSFVPVKEDEPKEDQVVLDVWINRGRNYVDLLQKMIDNDFTAKTGIKVNVSLMPSEQKLILANSSGVQPDLAFSVATGTPYEFAIRNAALDLSEFDDFNDYIKKFSPGALMSYIIDDSVFALPETQDFYLLFYRKDILDSLDVPIPQTWDEIIEILPELQRNGMNFYSPLAKSGSKPLMFTSPFIYQYGGDLFQADAMGTELDSEESLEAMKMMTNLFTIYGVPLQVPNFYNHFRYGTLPIGIGNFEDYLKLKTAAPELEGSWGVALHPGVMNNEGEVQRWAAGSAQASIIFKDTEHPEEAWELLKWWMSTDTQVEYAFELQTLYGEEYLWNSANLEAFAQLPWDEADKETILGQWDWLREVPKTPGSYMAERELSNAWNKIVFDDANPRSAIDDSITVINREIRRKMEEFGYTKNGEVIKSYEVPTIEKIEGWVRD